jgi:lysozyme family protein
MEEDRWGLMTDQIIYDVIKREGDYSNLPSDKGGPTNYGITQATLSTWRGTEVTSEDVKKMSIDEAADIYRELYLHRPKIDLIQNPDLRAVVFDTGVNNGTATAIRLLQQAIGTKPDGILGQVTLGVAKSFDSKEIVTRFLNARQAYDNNLVARNPSQEEFAQGWKNRIDELRTRYA